MTLNCSICLLIITSITLVECKTNLKSTLQDMKKDAKEMGRLILDTDYTKVTKADTKNVRNSLKKIIEHLDILEDVASKVTTKSKSRDRRGMTRRLRNNLRELKKVTKAMKGTKKNGMTIADEKEIKRNVRKAVDDELNVLRKLENQKRANLYKHDLLEARKIQKQAKNLLNSAKRSYTTWLPVDENYHNNKNKHKFTYKKMQTVKKKKINKKM